MVWPISATLMLRSAEFSGGPASLQLVRDLVEAGLGAGLVLVAAGRSGDGDGADRVAADNDRQAALRAHHLPEMHELVAGIGAHALLDVERRLAIGQRRVGAAIAVLGR